MIPKSTSLIAKGWKTALVRAAFGGVLMFGGVTSARAESCQSKLYKQEQKVNDAINRYGYQSRQANSQQHELGELQQKCGYSQNNGYHNRDPYYRQDPYYSRDPYYGSNGNYGRNRDYRQDRDGDYGRNRSYGYNGNRDGNYNRKNHYYVRRIR